MSDRREVVILANPYSGSGANRRRVETLSQALAQRGMIARQVWDLDERAALLAEPGVGERYRCIVSAGGDGSMAGVVNDLGQGGQTSRAAIAMLPMGNENLFAKEFGYDCSPGDLADAIDRLETRTIDVGDAGGRLFTLMASAGFDSEVVVRVDRWRRETRDKGLKRVNRLSYAPRIAGTLRDYRYPPLTLSANGQRFTGVHVFVFNIGKYGGGLRLGSHADPADGLLDYVIFQKGGLVRLAHYGLSALLGTHLKRSDVFHGKAAEIRIECADQPDMPLQTDGDPGGVLPVSIRVRPSAMRVLVV